MVFLLGIFWAVLVVTFGLILLTRKKYMVKREYDGIFTLFMFLMVPGVILFEYGYGIHYIVIFVIPASTITILLNRKRYNLFNINNQIVSSILNDILTEKNIAFEQNKNSIILVDYDDSEIILNQSLNSVEVNFRGVKNPHIYKEIKSEIKSRIGNIHTTVLPLMGLYFIAIGLIIIIALLYFEGRIL